MEKPVIFAFTTAYHPFIGGAEIAVQETAKRLKDSFRFFIVTARLRRDLPKTEEREEGTVIRVGFGNGFDKFLVPFWGAAVTIRLMRRMRPALFWPVMVSFAGGIPYIVNILRFRDRIPVLLTLQEGDSEAHIRGRRAGLIGFSWRMALARTDHLHAISGYLENLARQYGWRGKASVVPNGVDIAGFTKEFSPDELKKLRESMGIRPDEKVLVTAGRLVRKNAIDCVVRGLAIFAKNHPDMRIKFLNIGSGEEEGRIRNLARELGVLERIIFAGVVPHAELPKYLKISDIFIRPSRSEGLGNAFIEAMAAGIPVIATPVGGITDFLVSPEEDPHNATGIFVGVDSPAAIAEKIFLLLRDDDLRRRLVENAKRSAIENYDWERIAGRFRDLFREVIDLRARRRILIAAGIFPPDIGGPATYAALLLRELPKRGVLARVLAYADSRQSADGAVAAVSRRLPKGARHLAYFFHCLRLAGSADIVYALDAAGAGLPAFLAAKFLRKRMYIRVAGDYAWEQGTERFGVRDTIDEFQRQRYGRRVETLRRIQSFVARSADRVVVPSRYLAGIVSGWGVADERISVIPNAVDFPAAMPERAASRRELGIPDGEKAIVSAGRLVLWKGFGALIEIMPRLLRRFPSAKLYIAGDGPERDRLKEIIRSVVPGGRAVLIGGVSRDRLLRYLCAADVFALNTGYEGFSHQLIEAMAASVAVATTPSGGNAEIARDDENALLFGYNRADEMLECISRLLENPELRKRLAANALMTARRFTRERMIDEFIALI